MRIAVWHNLPSGGGLRCLAQQIDGLVSRGHEVSVWCPTTASALELGGATRVDVNVLDLHTEATRLRTRLEGLGAQNAVSRRLRAMTRHSQVAAAAMAAFQPDVFLLHPCQWFRAPMVARWLPDPTVIYLQEPFRPLYEAMPRLRWIGGLPEDRCERAAIAGLRRVVEMLRRASDRRQAREELRVILSATQVLVNSRYSREVVLRVFGRDARVCRLGVDTRTFAPAPTSRSDRPATLTPTVISVGAFFPEKGAEFVLRAVARVRPKPKLVWIGNAAWPSYLEDLEKLACDVDVTFEPRTGVSDDALVEELRSANVFVYAPSLEPLGYAPLEAMSCGTPVVAVAEAGVRETVIEGIGGRLVDARDEDAFAAAVSDLLSSPETVADLGRSARRHVEDHWSSERATGAIEAELERVVRAPPNTDP